MDSNKLWNVYKGVKVMIIIKIIAIFTIGLLAHMIITDIVSSIKKRTRSSIIVGILSVIALLYFGIMLIILL